MILVIGATGAIGKHVVKGLALRGEAVKAFVRDASKGDALGVELALGDLDDPRSIASAIEGCDQIFLNSSGAVPVVGDQPMIAQQKNVIDQARKLGVGHIVKVSVLDARPGGELAEGAHWQIEQHLQQSGIPSTVLAPSSFMQNFITGAGAFDDEGNLVGSYGDGRVSYIDAADIAACAVAVLTDETARGRRHLLTGPEALTHQQIAEALSRATGRNIRYIDLPPYELASLLEIKGLPTAFANDVASLFTRVAKGSLDVVTNSVTEITGNAPKAFDQFLVAHRSDLSI